MSNIMGDAEQHMWSLANGGGGGGAVFKSVQRGTSTLTTSNVSAVITAVDLSKAFVQFTYNFTGGTPGEATATILGELTSTTNLQFRRWNAGTAVTIDWEVIEFTSGVNVQQIGGVFVGASNVLTIPTAVNMAKTFLVSSWLASGGGSTLAGYFSRMPRLSLASATVINVTRIDTATTFSTEVKVFVVEFK